MDKPLAKLTKKKTEDTKPMKEELLQLIPQKYKGSKETAVNNYMPTN